MAKVIKYSIYHEVNHGTEENPNIEQVITDAEIVCPTQAIYDGNYPIAEREAIPDTIKVTGEFDPVPETTDDILNAMLGVTV